MNLAYSGLPGHSDWTWSEEMPLAALVAEDVDKELVASQSRGASTRQSQGPARDADLVR